MDLATEYERLSTHELQDLTDAISDVVLACRSNTTRFLDKVLGDYVQADARYRAAKSAIEARVT